MKRTTVGLVLIAAALLSGCIVVPPRPYRYQGSASVTVVDSPRYSGGYDRGGYDRGGRDGRDYGPRRGW